VIGDRGLVGDVEPASGRKAYLEERIRLAQGSVERLEMELQKEIEQEKQFKKLRVRSSILPSFRT
jgi:TolA-binding protein